MGDLNDDPTDISIKKHLKTTTDKVRTNENHFFAPMEILFKKGIGSLAYNDRWNLFDQIVLSPAFVLREAGGYQFYQGHIFKRNFLLQREGRFKGYPFRTYIGNNYVGGYSDHLPSYVLIVKKIAK
jgi:hypothetical protein